MVFINYVLCVRIVFGIREFYINYIFSYKLISVYIKGLIKVVI